LIFNVLFRLILVFVIINRLKKNEWKYAFIFNLIGDWGLGMGDWGLGIGPNPQSPIPNPQSPILSNYYLIIIYIFILYFIFKKKCKNEIYNST